MNARSIALALALGMLSAALSGCASNRGGKADATALPIGPADWPMYQYSSDRNAVLAEPRISASWSYDAKAKVNGGLALANGLLVLETFNKDVIALDARTGALRWRSGKFRNILMTTPVIANGLVYVGTGANPILPIYWSQPILKMTYGGRKVLGVPQRDEVAALDITDGKKRWSYETLGENMPSPAYVNGRIVFVNGDWHGYALRSDTGQLLWRTNVNGYSAMSNAAVIGNDVVMGICRNGIFSSSTIAIDSTTGKVRWEAPYGHCDGSPAVGNGEVFVQSVVPGSMKFVGRNRVAALDAKTGKVLWTYVAPKDGVATVLGSDEGSVAGMYHDGVYYQAFPLEDSFIAFDARTGKIRWQMPTSGPVKMSAVLSKGTLYFGDTTGVMYAVEASSGKLIRAVLFKEPFTTSAPIVVGRTLYAVNGTQVLALPI
jgi:outer membrane protein assembly factor BamB